MSIKTIEAVSQALVSGHQDPRTYTFFREEGFWSIHLPEFLKEGGRKEDLA